VGRRIEEMFSPLGKDVKFGAARQLHFINKILSSLMAPLLFLPYYMLGDVDVLITAVRLRRPLVSPADEHLRDTCVFSSFYRVGLLFFPDDNLPLSPSKFSENNLALNVLGRK